MGMFVNGRGVKWTLLALAGVAVLCLLDLRCSFRRDRRRQEEQAKPSAGVIAHVKDEIAAGRKEANFLREDQLNAQIRDLRVMARNLAKKGETTRVRATISLIQELEEQRKRLQAR